MTIEEIVVKYLKDNKFDGLCNPDGECGCNLDEIFPCDGYVPDCKPAYEIEDKTGEYSYIMTTKKPNEN